MHRNGLYAAVLELFGQVDDNLRLMVPSQPRLHRHGDFHRVDNGAGDFKHLWNVAQHTGSGPLPGHFLDGATEIDIKDIGTGSLHNPGGFDHRLHLAAVNLDGRRAFLRQNGKFSRGSGDIADKRVGGDKLGVSHIRAQFFTYQAKRLVGDVLHRSQHHRTLSQVDISYFHNRFYKITKFPLYNRISPGNHVL